MQTKIMGNDLLVTLEDRFDLETTLLCGQCFRFFPCGDGFQGVGLDHPLTISQPDEHTLLFRSTTQQQFDTLWRGYFDLDGDYAGLRKRMSAYPPLAAAADFTPGLRVLRQDSWEALATFILSQNNNIKRITGIVQRLCQCFGDPLEDDLYTFPSAQRLAALSPEDFAPLRAGFRAKYLLDAARKVADGQLDLDAIAGMDTDQAAQQLCTIHGVGPKVARCALLYGFGHADALPVDVWIGRILDCHFPDGFPTELSDCAGLVQQFMFEYVRHCPDALNPNT